MDRWFSGWEVPRMGPRSSGEEDQLLPARCGLGMALQRRPRRPEPAIRYYVVEQVVGIQITRVASFIAFDSPFVLLACQTRGSPEAALFKQSGGHWMRRTANQRAKAAMMQ